MAATDPQVLALAAQITESREQDIPLLLLKLKGILSSPSLGCEESNKIKQDIYGYGLTQYCLLVLKQDHSQLHGAWATAAQLAEILSHCCVGLEVKEDPEEFYRKFLPSVIDSLLVLGKRLQVRFIRAIKDKEKQDFLHWFQIVTNAICWLFGGHIQLAACVLQNDRFLQLLITDDVETAIVMMSVLNNILRINSPVLLQVEEETLHSVLDELVYKLSSTTNPAVGSAATKLLLLMAKSCKQLVRLFTARYKGQVNKYMQEMEEKSALTIQRFWRGYRARRIFHQQKQSLKEYKAAVIIQRAACKFLEKRRRRRPLSPWKEPKGLTDEQRLALQQKVDDYLKLHPASQMSEETSKELHMQAQAKLAQFLLRNRLDQRAAQRREALLAQVNTDVELLMNAPGLAETTEKDFGAFMSRSIPVATKARQAHNTMLKYTRWPWWKKLGDEFMEDDVIPDDAINTELETLFIGGRKSF
ncbi:IQ calmodulin-binding motif-containing protein 1 isoform X3 [Haemorhous mexicanus]|uniref:IQ calmodulin-binding motif-containing protein 1 isoform X3 n=1 Tax=Haemorhous mexicanus TaxID=30427 RepID=UPI0028BEC6B9|nr:IQ calmodulin-binding motif-containing protein 1 isoform X3 [Haemorhous mexicanus]